MKDRARTRKRKTVAAKPRPRAQAPARPAAPRTAPAPRRPGRPTLLTPAVHEALVGAIRQGNYLATAVKALGLDERTVRAWMERGEQRLEAGLQDEFTRFVQALTQARAQSQQDIVATLRRAINGYTAVKVKRTIDKDGNETQERVETEMFHPELGLEFLARTDPERWGRRDRHVVTGADGAPAIIQVVTGYEDEGAERASGKPATGQ